MNREEFEKAEAKLKASQEQEPIYMWRLEDDGWMDCTKEWFYSQMSHGYEKRVVYAAPVPAQQSINRKTIIDILVSSGNLSEGVTADLIIDAIGAQQSPAVAVPAAMHEDTNDEYASGWRRGWNECRDMVIAINPSPRITEQDAREIAESAIDFLIHLPGKKIDADKLPDDWIVSDEGRALLNKLNGGKSE